MQYPSFPLSTPFGPLAITPLGKTSLLAQSMESHDDPFSIHRVAYTLEIRLIRPDGTWAEPRDHSGLSMRRPNADSNHSFPSDAATKAVRNSVFPLLIRWADAHPRDFALAEAIHVAIQLPRQEQEVREAETALTAARQKRDALRTALDALQTRLDLDVTEYATLEIPPAPLFQLDALGPSGCPRTPVTRKQPPTTRRTNGGSMSPVPHNHTPQKILLVEDDPFIHTLTAASLTEAGYEVQWAATGEDALHKAVDTVPDLILLDLILPPPDGFELIRRFKTNPLTAHIPLLVLSVLEHETDVQRALECGATDYLVKSALTIKEIARRVASYLAPPGGP